MLYKSCVASTSARSFCSTPSAPVYEPLTFSPTDCAHWSTFVLAKVVKSQCKDLTCTMICCFGKRTYFLVLTGQKIHSKTKYFLHFVLLLPKQRIIVQVRQRSTESTQVSTIVSNSQCRAVIYLNSLGSGSHSTCSYLPQ